MKKNNVIPGNTQRAKDKVLSKNSEGLIAEIGVDQAFEKFSSLFIFITYMQRLRGQS